MSTGMRERTRTGESGPRRRLVAAVVFAAALLVVVVAVGVVPLLVGNDDEIAPVEQTTTTTVVAPVVETSLVTWGEPVVMPWIDLDGSRRTEVVEGPTGYLAHVRINGESQWRDSEYGRLRLSSDGEEWASPESVAASGALLHKGGAVTGTGSEFLVLGSGVRDPGSGRFDWPAFLSADGQTWDEIDLGPVLDEIDLAPGLDDPVLTDGFDVRAVTYGDAGYVAVGSIPFAQDWGWTDWLGVIAHSPDGREWTVFHGETFGLGSIDLSQFVVGFEREDGYVLLERRSYPPTDFWSVSPQDVVHGPAGYVAVGFHRLESPRGRRPDATIVEAVVWLSPDGRAWERIDRQPGFEDREMHAVAHGPGGYVAIGDAVWASTNGRDWRLVREDIRGSSIAAGAGGYLAVDTSGGVWHSPNGTDWSEVKASDLPGGRISGVSVFDDRVLLTGTVEVGQIPTTAFWWGTVSD